MTADEMMIAHGELIPIGGGGYVYETRRLPGLPVAIRGLASPMRAEWPAGVEPRVFDRTIRAERPVKLSAGR